MKKISSRSYMVGFRTQFVPVVIWLGTLAVVVAMFTQRSKRFQMVGLAQGNIQEIAATCTGRLTSVSVDLFDEVEADQLVAVIDTLPDDMNQPQLTQARLATVQAEVERLQAELEATKDSYAVEAANVDRDAAAEQRRYFTDVESGRLQSLELKREIETDRLTLESMALDDKIFMVQGRLDANDTGIFERKKLQKDYNVVVERIENNRRLLAQVEANLTEAQQRLDRFSQRQPQHPAVDKALSVISGAITVQERLMEELHVKRVPLELKSPFRGVVSLIQRQAGETVVAGQPILTVAQGTPTEIVAYATEKQASRVNQTTVVELVRRSDPSLVSKSQVVAVGPTVEQIPQRLWQNPNVPEWGRPIMIKVPLGMRLAHGEAVGIRGL